MIIQFKPGYKVRALKPTVVGWQGVGIVLSVEQVPHGDALPEQRFDIVNVAMMDGPYVGKKAQFLPEELTLA